MDMHAAADPLADLPSQPERLVEHFRRHWAGRTHAEVVDDFTWQARRLEHADPLRTEALKDALKQAMRSFARSRDLRADSQALDRLLALFASGSAVERLRAAPWKRRVFRAPLKSPRPPR